MPRIVPVCKYGVSLRGFDVCTRWAKANLGKLQSAGMLTWWCFERFFDTIIWLLSWEIHGRGSRPGRVFVPPSRGAYLFIGSILHQLGEKCDRLGWEGGSQSNAAKPFIQYSLLCLQVFLKNCYLSNSLGTLRLEPDKCIPRL